MSKTKKAMQAIQESEAAATIEPHAADFTSKAMLMTQGYAAMAAMDASTLEKVLAQIGHEADQVPGGAAASNKASIEPHGTGLSEQVVKEDLANLFGTFDLSEDFKSKMGTIFEAAVSMRAMQIEEEVKEAAVKMIEEEVAEITEALVDNVDKYLTLAAETFIEKNQLAIDNSLRAELSEDFIAGLFRLFQEHNFRIPDEQVDVVESLTQRVAALEEAYNEKTEENLELLDITEGYVRKEIVSEAAQGLAMTQAEKLAQLAEGIQFKDVEDFQAQVAVLREHHFQTAPGKKAVKEVALFEDAPATDEDKAVIAEDTDHGVATLKALMPKSSKE